MLGRLYLILIVLIIVACIIILVSTSMISYSTKINVLDRTYEIGVLKSLGANKKIISNMFLYNNFIHGMLIFLLTAMFIVIINLSPATNYLVYNGISIYNFKIWHLIPIFILSVIITCISSLGMIRKKSKMTITESLRKKDI